MPSPDEVAYMHAVADKMEREVIANATPGRWRAGNSAHVHEWSTLITQIGDNEVYHLGTAIAKPDQRAIMGGQPDVLNLIVTVIRAVEESTPPPLADGVLDLCRMYDMRMSLKVGAPAPAAKH
jgi:hypothetical protein